MSGREIMRIFGPYRTPCAKPFSIIGIRPQQAPMAKSRLVLPLAAQEPQGEAAVLAPPSRGDHPTMGSAAARLRPTPGTVPAFVMAPDVLIENAHLTPGQFAGWLGSRYEAASEDRVHLTRSRPPGWPAPRTWSEGTGSCG